VSWRAPKQTRPTYMKRVRLQRGEIRISRSIHLRAAKKVCDSLGSACSICLDCVRDRAIPNKCCHEFCFSCISSWSRIANDCPLCKTRFTSLHHYGLKNAPTVVPVEERQQAKDQAGAVLMCSNCGSPEDEDNLFLCDGPTCSRAFHLYCVIPELLQPPEEPWLCAHCERNASPGSPDGNSSSSTACSRGLSEESDSWDSDNEVKWSKLSSGKRRRHEQLVKNKKARTSPH